MLQVAHGIEDGSLAFCLQESGVERYLTYATLLSHCPHLVVRKVAWYVAQRLGVGVRAYDWRL